MKVKIIFVSNLNTCRSPMAEFIMKYLVNCQGLNNEVLINSAGLNVEPETSMNPAAVRELHRHQIPCIKKTAMQFVQSDFEDYDYVICMSFDQIRKLSRGGRHKNLHLLLDFDGSHRNINNPIPNGSYPFTYASIYKGCEALLKHIQKFFKVNNPSNYTKTLAKTSITLQVNEDLLKRFESALVLTKDNLEVAIEKSMDYYISAVAKTLTGAKVIQATSPVNSEFIDKFVKRWAQSTGQINHIIIQAYLKLLDLDGKVTQDKLKAICSNKKDYPELFIYKSNGFDNYYRQMKVNGVQDGHVKFGQNIEGKIFFEDGDEVKILSEIAPSLERYKSYFRG